MMFFNYIRQLTIRQRLTIIFASSAILILLFAGYLIYSFSAIFRKKEFKLRLESRLEEVQDFVLQHPNGGLPPFSKYDNAVLPREQLEIRALGDTLHLPSPEGTLIVSPALFTESNTIMHFPMGKRDFALLYEPTLQQLLVVSAIDVYGYTKMNNLRKVILLCLAVSVLLLGVISWYWTRRLLWPIAAKIKKAQMIGTGSLNLRLEVKNPHDELGMLAITFNDMLNRLEQGFVTQQQFIGNASHELRTPLTILRSEAEWALARPRTDTEYQQVLGKVQEKSLYLTNLVNRLLILARINGPAQASDMKTFRLEELLIQVVEQINNELTSKAQPTCTLILPSQQECVLQADAAMIQTAVTNLLENAVKYGEGKPISVFLTVASNMYSIAVHDHGIGISETDREQIFTPFFRANAARVIAGGTGLGLALVKAIAQWHGGSITLLSPQPHTVFELLLPVQKLAKQVLSTS